MHGGMGISLSFAGKALAGEGLDKIAELHFHENHRDLMGGEAGFFDDFIDGLVASREGFQDGVFLGAEVDEVLDRAGFFVFRGLEIEVGKIFEDL